MYRQYWDSTSLSALQNCPRKYQYAILGGWITKTKQVDLEFGLHYHKALEIYDKAKALGMPHKKAAVLAADYVLSSKWDSDDKRKNRTTLLRSVVWYTEQYKDDFFETLMLSGVPAVELSFAMPLSITTPDGDSYILCGHLDKAARERTGDTYVVERKTTGKPLGEGYYRQFSPNLQVTIYTIASRVVLPVAAKGVMIDAAQTLIEGTNFGRHLAHRSQAQLEEALNDICYWIKKAEEFVESDYWPKNESSCFLCEFKDICKRDPTTREMWLKAEYIQRAPWDPSIPR